jgi:DNA-binding transcriptional MocR family regulator
MQLALANYFTKGYYQTHIKKINRALAAHCTSYIEFLQHNLPENSVVFTPNGGLVLWIKLLNVNTEKLAARLLEEGAHIKAGNLFSTTPRYQDCFRINIGQVPTQQIYLQLALLCKLSCSETKL